MKTQTSLQTPKIWLFSPGKGTLTFPSLSGSLLPTFLCLLFRLPGIHGAPLTIPRTQGVCSPWNAGPWVCHSAVHDFIHSSGIPWTRCRGYWHEQARSPALKESLVQVDQVMVTPSVQHTWSRRENCAGSVMLSSAHWVLCVPDTLLSPDDAEVIQPAKSSPTLVTLAQPHSLDGYSSVIHLQSSSNMPPQQDIARSFKAETESHPCLHSIPWLTESWEFNLPILKCPLL